MSFPTSARELDDLVLQLKGLVHVKALLEARDAPRLEIQQHAAEIERVRARLAALGKQSGEHAYAA